MLHFDLFFQKYTLFLYNVDKSTKIRAVALDVLCSLLEKHFSDASSEDFKIGQFIEGLCVDMRSPKGSTGK